MQNDESRRRPFGNAVIRVRRPRVFEFFASAVEDLPYELYPAHDCSRVTEPLLPAPPVFRRPDPDRTWIDEVEFIGQVRSEGKPATVAKFVL